MRIEKDSFGEMSVPDDVLYGAQTARALSNFGLSGEVMPPRFIEACLAIKAAAAGANAELEVIADDKAGAIQNACLEARKHNNGHQFPVDVFQTGSGTSTNMNVNEVIARLAATAPTMTLMPARAATRPVRQQARSARRWHWKKSCYRPLPRLKTA